MSIACDLIEIPSEILDLVKSHPATISLYCKAFSNKEELNIGNLKQLSLKQKAIIKELYDLYPDRFDRIKQTWSIKDCRSVLNFKQYYYDEYILIKEYIPKIIEDGKKSDRLDLGHSWRIVNFLFTNCILEHNELLTWNRSGLGINILLYHKNFLDSLDSYYLKVNEVRELAELIKDFADEIISDNIEQINNRNTSIEWVIDSRYKTWRDKSYLLYTSDLCNSVKNFYCEVADRGNCVIISIC